MISGLFIVLYNHYKPYDAWQNNFLQQVCQLSIFFTLLAALMIRYNDARRRERGPEVTSPKDDDTAGVALLLVTTLPPASVFLMRVLRINPEFMLYWSCPHPTDRAHAVNRSAPTLNAANARRMVWSVLLQARDDGGDAHEKVLEEASFQGEGSADAAAREVYQIH